MPAAVPGTAIRTRSRTGRVTGLRCRACGTGESLRATHLCEVCFGPLEVEYDSDAVAAEVSREAIAAGPATMWRYAPLLPLGGDGLPAVTLDEGWTPLLHARNLGARLGLDNLYLKNDSVNPTNSFKDRVVAVAVNWALQNGIKTIACASTGNLANAVAAYAARAGVPAVVFVPTDLEPAKLLTTAVFGPTIVPIAGTYDDVNRICSELADDLNWGFCNINLRPFYSEGSKTLTYETCEQLGWRLPDEIVVPVASGCQFVKHHKAAGELLAHGLVSGRTPRLTGAQAAGCGPVAAAWESGLPVTPVVPRTIARSIAIGNPSDGNDVVRIAQQTGGLVSAVPEDEIVAGIRLLAECEGVFTETAGGVVIAALTKLAAQRRWRGDETVVAYVTGHGLKTLDAVGGLEELPPAVPPQRDAVRNQLQARGLL